MSAAAAHAYVGGRGLGDGGGWKRTEVESPAIDGEPRAEQPVENPEDVNEPAEERLRAVGEQDELPLRADAVAAIQERQRGVKHAGGGQRRGGRAREERGDAAGSDEGVDVAASAAEPAINAVGERRGVGNGDVEKSCWAENADDFGGGVFEAVDVFEAVVGDDGVERGGREGKAGGVGEDEVGRRRGGRGLVQAKDHR